MNINRRIAIASVALSLLLASSVVAAPRSSWDGAWSGAWGGRDPTSITIAGNRVVSYDYGGATTPVASSVVTPNRVTYGDNGVTVILVRTGANTASAKLHSQQGDATATLTRRGEVSAEAPITHRLGR